MCIVQNSCSSKYIYPFDQLSQIWNIDELKERQKVRNEVAEPHQRTKQHEIASARRAALPSESTWRFVAAAMVRSR
jgi:hypothetical protein